MSRKVSNRINKTFFRVSKIASVMVLMGVSAFSSAQSTYTYPIVDTNQTQCSDNSDVVNTCPVSRTKGFGQDAQYQGNQASYTINNNGTVTDNITGLIWAQTTDINGDGKITAADKVTFEQGAAYAANLELAGFTDWRVPTIKELYSLILFDGEDPSGLQGAGSYSIRPFIDQTVFGFGSGDTKAGERLIDSQFLSSTKYVSTTMRGEETVFGINFIDGRIKGYGITSPRGDDKTFYLLTVRGNSGYGINQFVDNGNMTVTDQATGLIWQQNDSKLGMDWFAALEYCETLQLAGNNDWRLPSVKELQSIVDYTKSPESSNSAAIDSVFNVTSIINEGGKTDYPNYWSSTTHHNLRNSKNAAYISFGRSMGYMRDEWLDVHGAGAQRSDPKTYQGRDFPQGHGPQGDAIRYNNYVRCVTGGEVKQVENPTLVERDSKVYQLDGSEAGMNKHSQGKSATSTGASVKPQRDKKRRDPMKDLDANGDGKLSKSEVRGPLQQDFDRLDLNGDGYITADELPARPPKN